MRPETELVTILGRLNPSESELGRAADLAAREDIDMEFQKGLVRRNKILPPFISNARRLSEPGRGRLLAALSEETTRLDLAAGREHALASLDRVMRLLGGAESRVMAVKGASMPFLLPEYRLRALGDLDLLFPDAPSIVLATRTLQKNGYEIIEGGEAPLVSRMKDGKGSRDVLVGHFTVYGHGCKFDMHSHNLLVTGCPLPPIDHWRRASLRRVLETEVWVPCPEDALLILLIHSASHGYFTLKDFNDAYALLADCGGKMDWDYLMAAAAASRLDRLLSFVLSGLEELFSFPAPVPAGLEPRLRPSGLLGRALKWAGTTWSPRGWLASALVAGLIGAEYGRRPGGSRIRLSLVLWHVLFNARRLYEDRFLGSLADALLRNGERPPFFRPAPPRHVPVYLTDVTPELLRGWLDVDLPWEETPRLLRDGGLEVESLPEALLEIVRDGPRELVACPAGLFIPTMTFVFGEEEYQELQALGTRVLRTLATRLTVPKEAGYT